jgi:hypothetical protein
MAYFDIMEKSISWDGAIRISKNNPDNIEVDTSQLQVRIPALASLNKYDDSHYLVTSRSSRRTISTITIVAMSISAGTLIKFLSLTRLLKQNDHGMVVDSEPHIGGDRRYHLPKPTNDRAQFNLQMNMSDDFHMTIAKFETLKDGSRGPQSDYAQSVLPSLAGSR